MNHDELLEKIDYTVAIYEGLPVLYTSELPAYLEALRAVVTLHTPIYDNSCFDPDCCGGPYHDLCDGCEDDYPCPTIQAIEKELG
jgi:hypothetical protein